MKRKIILSKLEAQGPAEFDRESSNFYILTKDEAQGENLGFAFSRKVDGVFPMFFQKGPLPGEREKLIGVATSSEGAEKRIHEYMLKEAQKEVVMNFGPYAFYDLTGEKR